MDRLGFIREKFDIKLLILYVLRMLPAAISLEELSELVLIDDGFGYFDYTECLSELVETGHVGMSEDGYQISPLGATHGEAAETSIPYSVRTKAQGVTKPVIDRMRRDALIAATHEPLKKGGFNVKLSLSDDMGKLMTLTLLNPDEEQSKAMEKRFRANAEEIYQAILQMLTPEK